MAVKNGLFDSHNILPLSTTLFSAQKDSTSTKHTSIHKIPPSTAIMRGTSSVGQGSVYEAGDKQSELDTAERYSEGVPNSHKPNDSSIYSQLSSFPIHADTPADTPHQRMSAPLPIG